MTDFRAGASDLNWRLSSRRRMRRISDGAQRLPFIPFGIVPAVLLGLLAFYCVFNYARKIEDRTRVTAQTALREGGLDWASVKVNGQRITIEGTPPDAAAGLTAIELVDDRLADAPFFQASPATRVRLATQVASVSATAPTPTQPTSPRTISNDWSFRVGNGVLRLEGYVPDEATRARIVETANAGLSGGRYRSIENALQVSNTSVPDGYQSVAMRGVNTVSRCDRATSSFTAGRFDLYCELSAAAEAGVRAEASASLPYGTIGKIDILSNEAVSSCEGTLATLLSSSKIEFASGLANIPSSNNFLLDNIARAAANCPGRLRIEGHTDSEGSAVANDRLSQQRAEAVRRALEVRGVRADRLVAEGFGSREPIGDNFTPAGRALNRRIEVEVVRQPD